METAVLVSVATGALKPVLEKLFTLMGDEYTRFKHVRKEILSLTKELTAMHAFLLEMSEVEEYLGAQDKTWMNKVRELSYDMEDSIDDFMKHVGDEDAQPDSFMKKIKRSWRKVCKMKTRRRIAIKIQDLKKQIIDEAKRNERYKAREAFSKTISHQTVDPRALVIFERASELVGIDKPKNELVKLLTEEDLIVSAQQQPKMVSIVGSGGIGKTTLANQVYEELKGQFEYKAFLSVPRNPDMMNILAIILSKISDTNYEEIKEGSVQQLIMRIKDFLLGKRYFIVVDDIWDNDAWDIIKCIFPDDSHGSKIITTTRRKDVAESCQSLFGGHIYKIRPLDMEYSRQLFHKRLFVSEEECPADLKEVSDKILKKCDGLPLAIIVISGLLVNTERTLWNHVNESIGNALEENYDVKKMKKIFSLSYFDLPLRLKTCLLYLSLFPEDCIIEKKRLIRRWIAEGFIHKEGIYTSVEVGEKCFNELINRTLIQPVRTNINGKVETCRVHDIILDFIISKSVEENFVTLVGDRNPSIKTQSTVRRLSLQVGKQGSSILKKHISLSHVRSLSMLMFEDPLQIPSLDMFKHLRVMDLEGCRQLETHHLANIGRLYQLTFLSLKGTWIDDLPEEIGRLSFLETLDLRFTCVYKLPKSIVNLEKLVHLLGEGFSHSFPNGIAKMQALETLRCVDAFEQSLEFLQELGQLQNMTKLKLDLYSTSSVEKEWVEALVSSLQKLCRHKLSSVTLWSYPCSLLMEPWYSAPDLAGLQELFAWDTVVPHVPNWMRFLVNLQQLYLEVKGVRKEDLCILGGLPALLSLTLVGSERSKEKLIVNCGVGFPCLKEFAYILWGRGMELMFAAGSMPKLEKLVIGFNAAETESLCGTSGAAAFDFGIENLPCLVTIKCICEYQTSPAIEAAKAAMERAASTHPKSPTPLFTATKTKGDYPPSRQREIIKKAGEILKQISQRSFVRHGDKVF